MDDKIPERTCPVCRRPFKEQRDWQIYCCPACRMKGWQVKKEEKALKKKVNEVLEKVREEFLK